MKFVFPTFVAVTALLLTACTALVPNDGPLLKSVTSEKEANDDFVYGLVNLNAASVAGLVKHDYFPLSSKFGLGQSKGHGFLGVGDVLQITIFEAGPDGIFSTLEKKSVTIKTTVQQNGRISVPYVGTVEVAGKSVESVRRSIVAGLRNRAVEPDVIVETEQIRSRTVVVNGAVNSARLVPLVLGSERVLDAVGMAGGPSKPPYETYISVSRGNATRTALLQTLINTPKENIYVRPGDALFLSHNPRQFLALGAVKNVGRHPFGSENLDLLEATAVAGGFEDVRSNPEAMFVFRYEYPHVVKHLYEAFFVDDKTLERIADDPNIQDKEGRIPIIYRIDLSDADNFFVAKRFPVRAGDAIYVARKGSVDFSRVVDLLAKATFPASFIGRFN